MRTCSSTNGYCIFNSRRTILAWLETCAIMHACHELDTGGHTTRTRVYALCAHACSHLHTHFTRAYTHSGTRGLHLTLVRTRFLARTGTHTNTIRSDGLIVACIMAKVSTPVLCHGELKVLWYAFVEIPIKLLF